MSITSPDARVSSYNPVVPTTEFAAGFPVFDDGDLIVLHDGVARDDFSVSATYSDGISSDAKVVFEIGLTGTVRVVGGRQPHRSNRFNNGAPLPIRDQNLALDTVEAEIQELHRDMGRAVKAGIGATPQDLPEPETGKVLGWSAGGILANMQLVGTTALFGTLGLLLAASDNKNEALRLLKLPTNILDALAAGCEGDGAANDYPAMEAALRSSEGGVLIVPPGIYRMENGSPRIGSNTFVILQKGAVILQPNYYSYNRPTEPYVRQNVVDWNGFYFDVGTENIYITGGGQIRGPFWQPEMFAYNANPVQNWPASNGIHARGHDYEWRHDLPLSSTPSKNINICDIHIEGFGEDAIQLDQVDNARCRDITMHRCGRGGIRLYGVVDGWMMDNEIYKLFPGDYLNNGNRMYGITATRCYLGPDDRASENIWMVGNTAEDIPYWKGFDTHGGINIRFLYNKAYNCHIGVGIDKGGFTVDDGISPARNIWVIGNRLIRTAPDHPNEGDTGVAGPAIQAFGHDATDAQVGRGLVIDQNICVGWGEDTRFGAFTFSNFIGAQIGGQNQLYDSRRAAICIRERFEGSISDDLLIDDVRRSSLGVQDGISIETAEAVGRIGNVDVVNRQATTLRAIVLSTPSANKGFKIDAAPTFRALGAGSITKVANPQNEQSGPWTMRKLSMVRTQVDGTIQNSRGDISYTVTNPVAGQYVYTMTNFAFVALSSGFPELTIRVNGFRGAAEVTNLNEITVWTRNAAGADTNCGHILHVYGY